MKFQKGSSHRTIPDRTSDGPRSPSVKPPSHSTISDRTKSTVGTWEEVAYSQKCTITYAISRSRAKVVLRTHKSLTRKSRTITYAISRSHAQDIHRTHKLPRAHKSYTYAISRLRAKDVFSTQSRLQGTSRTTYVRRSLRALSTNQQDFSKNKKKSNPFFPLLYPFITSIMARIAQVKSTQLSSDWTKKRSGIAAPTSLEDLMDKEVQSSTQDSAIRELSVLSDPTNEQSTKIKC